MTERPAHPIDELFPYVSGDLPAADAARVEAHVGQCQRCQADVEAIRAADVRLRSLAVSSPAALAAPVLQRLAFRRRLRLTVAAAAVVLLAVAAGAIWQWRQPTPPAAAASTQPLFMLLFEERVADRMAMPAADRPGYEAAWNTWIASLRAQQALVAGGRRLRDEAGVVVSAVDVVDRAGETPELGLTGYFLVRARDYEAATAYARGCPILDHGGRVIVREVWE